MRTDTPHDTPVLADVTSPNRSQGCQQLVRGGTGTQGTLGNGAVGVLCSAAGSRLGRVGSLGTGTGLVGPHPVAGASRMSPSYPRPLDCGFRMTFGADR